MSKLADAIRRSQRVEAAPIGFGAARSASPPSMLVGALVAAKDAEKAAGAGADVIILEASTAISPEEVRKARAAVGEGVLGATASVANSEAAKELREAGLDFLLVIDSTPAAALLDDDLGYSLTLPNQPEELFLRSLEAMAFEAVYLEGTPSPLTVAGQIGLSRIAGLARKPLLSKSPAEASVDDLRCLRAVGVVGVIGDAAGVAKLKETVASLPPRRGRREQRSVVALPHAVATAVDDDDDDDE